MSVKHHSPANAVGSNTNQTTAFTSSTTNPSSWVQWCKERFNSLIPPPPPSSSTTFRAVLIHYLYQLLQVCWLIILMIVSSDPHRYLPPKKRHPHGTKHHHHQQHFATPNRLAATVATPFTTPTPTTRTPSTNNTTIAPPPPPLSTPFLSKYCFPIPSSCLPAARYWFNLEEVSWPVRLLSKCTGGYWTPTSVSIGGANGTQRASTSAEALTLLKSTPPRRPVLASPTPSSNYLSYPSPAYHHHSSPSEHKKKRWTLVLDLDETLVHTTDKVLEDYDCRVEIHTKKQPRVFYILKRPYLDTFLATLSTAFEIVIFTASIQRYADAVIDLIDSHQVVQRRFFRPSCLKSGVHFLKDLRNISSTGDLRRTILIDNSPIAYSLQEENGLPISTWMSDEKDTALKDLIPVLFALRAMDDVRPVLYRRSVFQRYQEAKLQSDGMGGGNQTPQIPLTSAIIEADESEDTPSANNLEDSETPSSTASASTARRVHRSHPSSQPR